MQYIVRFHGSGAEANRRLRAAGVDRFNSTADYFTAAASVPEFGHHRTVVEADSEENALSSVQAALGGGFAAFSANATGTSPRHRHAADRLSASTL